MNIETKYNIGDKVYILSDNRIHTVEIESIQIKVCKTIDISYSFVTEYNHLYEHKSYNENYVFKTIDDLTKYLIDKHHENDRNK